jgi:hypothetical protein
MSESEIRALLRTICDDLDRVLHKVVLPTTLGVGLALGACSDDATPLPDTTTPDAVADASLADQQTTDAPPADQQVADAVPADQQAADTQPADQQVADTQPKWDYWPPPPYMAPDAAPLYRSLRGRC